MKKLIIVSIIILTSCLSFKTNSDGLIGKWKCYHKEREDGTTKSTNLFSGEEFEFSCNELIFDLKSDGTGLESLSEQNFKYELKDSILTIGIRQYIVESLSEKELVLRDKPSELTIFVYIQKFKRIE